MDSNENELKFIARSIAYNKQEIIELETFLNQSKDINHNNFWLPASVKVAVSLQVKETRKALAHWIKRFNKLSGCEVIKVS